MMFLNNHLIITFLGEFYTDQVMVKYTGVTSFEFSLYKRRNGYFLIILVFIYHFLILMTRNR